MHDARAAALAALPAHPVFATDLDAGIVAIAQRFEARDQDSAGYPFPSAENCFILLEMLAVARSTPLGALVDFSPLTVLLRGRSLGFERTRHGLHEVLDCLAQLALDPAHVITPDDPQAELAIQRLLAALHLALFGTLPVTVAPLGVLGCKPCGREIHAGPSWLGRAVGDAHAAGRLATGYRLPTALELAAHAAEYDGPFGLIRPHGILRLAVAAADLLATLTPAQLAVIEHWHPVRLMGVPHVTARTAPVASPTQEQLVGPMLAVLGEHGLCAKAGPPTRSPRASVCPTTSARMVIVGAERINAWDTVRRCSRRPVRELTEPDETGAGELTAKACNWLTPGRAGYRRHRRRRGGPFSLHLRRALEANTAAGCTYAAPADAATAGCPCPTACGRCCSRRSRYLPRRPIDHGAARATASRIGA